ncbi:hypothetical protein [Streptomyces xiamenensis]
MAVAARNPDRARTHLPPDRTVTGQGAQQHENRVQEAGGTR